MRNVRGGEDAVLIRVPEEYATIQSALTALGSPGGVIDIGPGTYTENLVVTGPVTLRGCGQIGPNWVTGQAPTCSIQATSGTILTIGGAASILDQGVTIEGINFVNTGVCQYGIHAGRMRCLTLRDCQFSNFQPTGCGLFLDGTSGWQEWATVDNCWFANCFQAMQLLNSTFTHVKGGGHLNAVAIPGCSGITTAGQSDTLTIDGWAALELFTTITLNGAANEMADLSGLRIENHLVAGIGVQCNTSNNCIRGRVYGLKNGMVFGPTAVNNTAYFKCAALTGDTFVNQGSNQVAG